MFTVSILTYTALAQAKACLAAVLQSEGEFELILTANGNPEAAAYFQELAAQRPNIRVVVNATNEGFIKPNTRALEMCRQPYFVLLNDDAIPPKDWLLKMKGVFDANPNAALVGCEGGCSALMPNFHGTPGALEYLEGSCLMGRTEILKKHGLFDPHLTMAYAEDSDLSLRMRELGYTIHRAPFRIQHERAATSKRMAEARRWQEANHAYCRKRWAYYLRARRFDTPTIIKRTGAWGDVLLLTPVIRALKEQRPQSPIYVETACPDIFARNPDVAKAAMKLPRKALDNVINLDGSYEACPDRNFVQTYAEAVGVTVTDSRTRLFPTDSDRQYAATRIEGDNWVAIHAGPSTWPGKEWEERRFGEVMDALKSDGFKILLVGSPPLSTRLRGDEDLRGRTTIHQMAAAIARCRLFIGLDSFPMHVAQAMGVPVIGLFGVTLPGPIFTSGSPAIALCADSTHPAAGIRHKIAGKTFTPTKNNPTLTISVEQVVAAARTALRTLKEPEFA